MSVRDYYLSESEKNIKLELEVPNFSNISYWIRSLKYRFRKDNINKIKLIIEVTYMPNEYNEKNEKIERFYKWKWTNI